MYPLDESSSPVRRRLLGTIVSAVAVLGVKAAGATANAPVGGGAITPSANTEPVIPEEIFVLLACATI